MNWQQIESDLIVKVLANVVFLILGLLYRRSRLVLERLNPYVRPISFVIICVAFVGLNVFIQEKSEFSILFFIVSTGIFIGLVLKDFDVFWRLGVLGGDRTIASGINYRRALSMCKDSLEFLGIGASKLIDDRDGFRKAVARCHRDDRPVRFLLRRPDDPFLNDIARRAGRPVHEYQETVKRSLLELRSLKVDRSHNIEVRFYTVPPLFRLMFINGNLCLASHYILGEGDGSQLPQLHILRRPPWRRDNESWYYPLHQYYDELWKGAEPWDFEKYT